MRIKYFIVFFMLDRLMLVFDIGARLLSGNQTSLSDHGVTGFGRLVAAFDAIDDITWTSPLNLFNNLKEIVLGTFSVFDLSKHSIIANANEFAPQWTEFLFFDAIDVLSIAIVLAIFWPLLGRILSGIMSVIGRIFSIFG